MCFRRKVLSTIALVLLGSIQVIAEGQTLSYSNQNYATVGLKFSGHMGKKKWASFGPEISFGHIYQDPFITSAAITWESINLFEGSAFSLRFQGGTYLIGASIALDLIRFEGKNNLGLDLGGWAGLGVYLEGSYLIAPEIYGFSISGKGKVPVYIEKKSQN